MSGTIRILAQTLASRVWRLTLVATVLLAVTSCRNVIMAVNQTRWDYDGANRKCRAIQDHSEQEECLTDVSTAQDSAIEPQGYLAKRAEERRRAQERAEQAQERQAIMARCGLAPRLTQDAVARGDFRGGLKITTESTWCLNVDAIRAAYREALRRRTPSEIARYRDQNVAYQYWQPVDFFHWTEHAAAGDFLPGEGVWIDGIIDNQIDDVVIIDVMKSGTHCGVRLKGNRYLVPGGMFAGIARFTEMGRFVNPFGGRLDLPVFDLVYP